MDVYARLSKLNVFLRNASDRVVRSRSYSMYYKGRTKKSRNQAGKQLSKYFIGKIGLRDVLA